MRCQLLLLGLAWCACTDTPAVSRAFCSEDGNCAAGETCVVDLDVSLSYCAALCEIDRDCPAYQRCQLGTPIRAGLPELSVCVDRVRTCAEVEACNGLDDDCDGVVDGPACVPVTGCLDDLPCGTFVCSAPVNQPVALCVAPRDPLRADGERCTQDDECRNGVCETGRCGLLCRPEASGVRVCPLGKVCAQGVGSSLRPAFNQCQTPCGFDGQCPEGTGERCLWRSVYQDAPDHHSVCAVPDTGRLALGAACSGNTIAGDDECQSGLCYGGRCTRLCGGPGTSCADVSATAMCAPTQLIYGVSEFARDVCVEP